MIKQVWYVRLYANIQKWGIGNWRVATDTLIAIIEA